MKMNKDKLLKFKGGRKLSIIFLFLFVFAMNYEQTTMNYCAADSIKIRTIITPVGSQSEKWGAKGLMVCIGGEPINVGGCGEIAGVPVTGAFVIDDSGTNEEPTFIKDNDVIIFEDTNNNHQYDYTSGSIANSDTVYEVRGGGNEYCYTYYSTSLVSCNCPVGETKERDLGTWGCCEQVIGTFDTLFRPPGVSCPIPFAHFTGSHDLGLACVCCK